jgi:hypothetical protein
MPVDTAKVWKVKINGIMMVDVLNKEEFGRCIREIFQQTQLKPFLDWRWSISRQKWTDSWSRHEGGW